MEGKLSIGSKYHQFSSGYDYERWDHLVGSGRWRYAKINFSDNWVIESDCRSYNRSEEIQC